MTNPERIEEKLDEIGRNPHQSFNSIMAGIVKRKGMFPEERGATSEAIIKFLVSSLPAVASVKDVHQLKFGLDADIKVDFVNLSSVYVQAKSSDKRRAGFLRKVRGKERKLKKRLRFVVLSTARPFNKIVEDFMDQVNNLEGRAVLKHRPQELRKRKSY